jgi:hypothetical protein
LTIDEQWSIIWWYYFAGRRLPTSPSTSSTLCDGRRRRRLRQTSSFRHTTWSGGICATRDHQAWTGTTSIIPAVPKSQTRFVGDVIFAYM